MHCNDVTVLDFGFFQQMSNANLNRFSKNGAKYEPVRFTLLVWQDNYYDK